MAGTHEENMKDPVWQAEQATRYKDELRKLQEKHDAQLAGIAASASAITSLESQVADLIEKLGLAQVAIQQHAERISTLTEALKTSHAQTAAETERANAAAALAKSRRAGLAQVAAVINPLLAAE